ncbi:hypothetical protein ACFXKS_25165 [Streptomyces scopuliridis]|uniref:hypothetical protein n=1 Tax=Streptomyces scopuliridis TaxID=452529 RepID=UPI0036B51D9A
MVQNYRDAAGRLRWRTDDDGGLPPSSRAVVSPYDPTAHNARCGQATRWKGFVAHLTETCPSSGAKVITDVATIVHSGGASTLATSHPSPRDQKEGRISHEVEQVGSNRR